MDWGISQTKVRDDWDLALVGHIIFGLKLKCHPSICVCVCHAFWLKIIRKWPNWFLSRVLRANVFHWCLLNYRNQVCIMFSILFAYCQSITLKICFTRCPWFTVHQIDGLILPKRESSTRKDVLSADHLDELFVHFCTLSCSFDMPENDVTCIK